MLAYYKDYVVDDKGNVVEGAEVAVYEAGTTNTVSLFTDSAGNSSLANPTQTTAKGAFAFYVAPGVYDVAATIDNKEVKFPSQTLVDPKLSSADSANASIGQVLVWNGTNYEFGAGGASITPLDDYSEKLSTMSLGTEPKILNTSDGHIFDITLTGNPEFTFSTARTNATTISILIRQDSIGGHSVIWPTATKWPSGVERQPSTAANAETWYTFVTLDQGNQWYGFEAAQDMAVV